jgi:hypothetical protein
MKTSTLLWVGGGFALVGLGISYRDGINKLKIDVDGFENPSDDTFVVRLKITNPNRFYGYPVPRMTVNAYDNTGALIGVITNDQLQYISANQVSYIYGTVAPDYTALATVITDLITKGQLPQGLKFHGLIDLGIAQIPFDTSQPLIGAYDPGLNV